MNDKKRPFDEVELQLVQYEIREKRELLDRELADLIHLFRSLLPTPRDKRSS